MRLNPKPLFSTSVKITDPGDEHGAVGVTFRHKTASALQDWWQTAKNKPAIAAVCEIVERVDGIHNDDGEFPEYSEALLMRFLDNYPAAAGELLDAYFACLTESRTKN